jgi:hypothetical protein
VDDGVDTLNAWCADTNDANQWVTINKGQYFFGIVLQGKTNGERIGYPTKFNLFRLVTIDGVETE